MADVPFDATSVAFSIPANANTCQAEVLLQDNLDFSTLGLVGIEMGVGTGGDDNDVIVTSGLTGSRRRCRPASRRSASRSAGPSRPPTARRAGTRSPSAGRLVRRRRHGERRRVARVGNQRRWRDRAGEQNFNQPSNLIVSGTMEAVFGESVTIFGETASFFQVDGSFSVDKDELHCRPRSSSAQ